MNKKLNLNILVLFLQYTSAHGEFDHYTEPQPCVSMRFGVQINKMFPKGTARPTRTHILQRFDAIFFIVSLLKEASCRHFHG